MEFKKLIELWPLVYNRAGSRKIMIYKCCGTLAIFLLFIFSTTLWAATEWRQLSPGLEYTKLSGANGFIHAFRIDPKLFNFQLTADQTPSSLHTLMNKSGAVLAVNGGYFSPELKPLGLRVSNGQILSNLRPITWWGVFYLRNSEPNIVSQREFRLSNNIDFAIQAGPRLVVDGEVPKLAPGNDDRTAIGITRNGKIILLATENFFLSTTKLGEIMRAPESENGLNCIKALNLDGGHSTQLYTNLSQLNIQRYNISQVADMLLVIPK